VDVDVVAHDYLGYPVTAASLHIDDCISAEKAEARAILTGLKLCPKHALKVSIVEFDYAIIVKSRNYLEPNTSIIYLDSVETSATRDENISSDTIAYKIK
jgi:SRSO17 transposase